METQKLDVVVGDKKVRIECDDKNVVITWDDGFVSINPSNDSRDTTIHTDCSVWFVDPDKEGEQININAWEAKTLLRLKDNVLRRAQAEKEVRDFVRSHGGI
jgi:hypothetical protein